MQMTTVWFCHQSASFQAQRFPCPHELYCSHKRKSSSSSFVLMIICCICIQMLSHAWGSFLESTIDYNSYIHTLYKVTPFFLRLYHGLARTDFFLSPTDFFLS